jgi:hypothetical protein
VALAPNQIDFIKEQFDEWEPAASRMYPSKRAKAWLALPVRFRTSSRP